MVAVGTIYWIDIVHNDINVIYSDVYSSGSLILHERENVKKQPLSKKSRKTNHRKKARFGVRCVGVPTCVGLPAVLGPVGSGAPRHPGDGGGLLRFLPARGLGCPGGVGT